MAKPLISLPIDRVLPELLKTLAETPNLILQAAPGTGKTTRVPPALLKFGEVLVLEPRRLAAKLAASRVAWEAGESVGKTVGYQFRFEKVISRETRLTFLTEGMLIRRLMSDPSLTGTSTVVLDEFHERHLHGDIALAHLRRLQKTKRPDLKIVVMSATLETEALSQALGGCPVLKADGRQYDVETTYLSQPPAKYLEILVRDAVQSAIAREDCGDILVFLPGMADIRRAQSKLEEAFSRKELLITPLHGELSREEQDAAVSPADRPKVILSTNVAETSLTIEGVRTVIDSGLHRMASYSYWSGVPSLKTRPISRASAIQRAGRAGRTAPGRCFRLYTKADFEGRASFDPPEIQRADLAQTLLELKVLGVEDLGEFEWFESPVTGQVASGIELLYRLGALESSRSNAALTPIGKKLAKLPAHPRLARFLIEASNRDDAATLAALIQEGRLEGLDALAQIRGARGDASVTRARSQLLSGLEGEYGKTNDLAEALLRGFPDRVGRLRKGSLVLSSGGSAAIEDAPVTRESEYFLVLEIQEMQRQGQARSRTEVRAVCPIREEWLFDLEPPGLKEEERVVWDAERKRVVASSVLAYGELVLSEDRKPPEDLQAAAGVLLREGLGVSAEAEKRLTPADVIRALLGFADPEAVEASLARMALLHRHFPELGVPAFDAVSLSTLLRRLVEGKLSVGELKDIDLAAGLIDLLPDSARAKVDQLLPPTVTLPGGRKPKVQYRLGQAPWIESRLQDFFGMKQGPSLLNGRLPLTLHLLAPNQRAVQITTDLAGFWQRAYREVRRELSRNYPRHSWPEDPLTAEPPKPKPSRR